MSKILKNLKPRSFQLLLGVSVLRLEPIDEVPLLRAGVYTPLFSEYFIVLNLLLTRNNFEKLKKKFFNDLQKFLQKYLNCEQAQETWESLTFYSNDKKVY